MRVSVGLGSVLPSLRSSLKWVAFRTGIDIPSLNEALFIALEKKVFTERGKPLKEAVPFTIELVKAMEIFVRDSAFEAAKVFLLWVLCMIFASLRFDDAVHVKPLERLRSPRTVSSGFRSTRRQKETEGAPSSWCQTSASQMLRGSLQGSTRSGSSSQAKTPIATSGFLI